MIKRKFDNRLLGLLIGLLGPLIILFGINIYEFSNLSFWLFLKTGFSTGTIAPWIKIAALFNLAPFFLFVNSNRLRTGQGIVFATILLGVIIVYFTLM